MDNVYEIEQPVERKLALIQQAEDFLSKRYHFRRNIILEKTEYKQIESNEYIQMRDRTYNSMSRELQKAFIKISPSFLNNILNSDYVDVYNPFNEYFEGLPSWDGVTDHISELAATVKTTDDVFWQDCFKRWLVALVGCALKEEITNHTVIVFTGKQGLGKTTWHLNLVPPPLKQYRFSGTVKPGSRDSIVHLSECLLINLDELESLNKNETGELKDLITKSAIRLRRAYAQNVETYIRRASFCGSVNKAQFLSDTTGSRRFLCHEVKEIEYQHNVDLDKVYAQALHLLNHGYQHWFDDAEIATILERNKMYEVNTAEEDLLLKYFYPGKDATDGAFYTPTLLAEVISSRAKVQLSNSFIQGLGKALVKNGFFRVKNKAAYGYLAKEIQL